MSYIIDFSMYILLRGQVTIFIQYANKTEDTDEKARPKSKQEPSTPDKTAPAALTPVEHDEPESVRKRLGTFVCSLGKYHMSRVLGRS